ncbi:MAG: hypothetical protein AAFP96_10370, partial [Bacteroidota bacterium]
ILMLTILVFTSSHAQKFVSSHTVGNEMKTYSKVLVVVKTKDAARRVGLEDDIVMRLKSEDINAMPSHLRLDQKTLNAKAKDAEAIEVFVSKLRENGFEGILVTSLVDAKESVTYNAAEYRTTTVPVRYGRFGRYYSTARVGVYEPATVEKHQKFILESLLYDLRESSKQNSLHWIGKIKVTDPKSFEKTSNKYAKTLVKKITKEAIQL